MSNESEPTFTPWEAWQQLTPGNWRKAVRYLALVITSEQSATSGDYRLLEEYIAEVRRGDWHKGDRMADRLIGAWSDALETGALVGYALARTYPSPLEEFEDWPRRALELAGLPIRETSEDDDPPDVA
jgi:hypothetical protein